MSLPVPKSLSQLQSEFLAGWNAYVGNAPGTVIPPSDPIVAIAGSNSGAALHLQGLIYDLVEYARASTSEGPDLDSWLADFGYARPQGAEAQVTLNVTINPALANPPGSVTIPQGALFQTGSIVVPPATLPAVYQVAANQAYVFTSPGTFQIEATAVKPVTLNGIPGYSVYNSLPVGAIATAYQPIAGVTSVSNPASPTGGTDAASDAATRADFIDWIGSLAKSTALGVRASVESAFGSLQFGVNYRLLTNSTAPTRVLPGLIAAVFVSPGNSGQYVGSPFDPNAQAILGAMQSSEALGLTPVVYYAEQYAVTAIDLTYTYSAAALNRAGLSVSALQGLISQAVSGVIPATGGALGSLVYCSALAAAILSISVTLPTGIVSGIVTDVDVPAMSFTTTGGTFGAGDFVQPGTPSALDQLGYLSWDPGTNPVTFTAIQAA
jgi:Baseplate J-like protein.